MNIQKYKFKTSLGEVVISFDVDSFSEKEMTYHLKKKILRFICDDVNIELGKDILRALYNVDSLMVFKLPDESLWVQIFLEDAYYGSPEYPLRKKQI